MSIRTFIFCDSCNPLGLRTEKDGFIKNRRANDVRSWYEGDEQHAKEFGWTKTPDGGDLCPKCSGNESAINISRTKDSSSRRFVGLARKS